jgi:hypothetical protein
MYLILSGSTMQRNGQILHEAESQHIKKPRNPRGFSLKNIKHVLFDFLKAFRHRQKIFTTNNHYEWSK